MNSVYKIIASPVGLLKIVAAGQCLTAVLWEKDESNRVRLNSMTDDGSHPVLLNAERQLTEYFSGHRKRFDLNLDFEGTLFQKTVWNALLAIPFGETRTYLQLAEAIGNPKAARAVGAAIGRNPIAVVVPCHRVIGSSGGLTGFAGGVEAKAQLLALESGATTLF